MKLTYQRITAEQSPTSEQMILWKRWLNDAETTRHMETHTATEESIMAYVQDLSRNGHDLFLVSATFGNLSHDFIGTCTVRYFAEVAVIGLMIGDARYWGFGIGRRIIERCCEKIQEKQQTFPIIYADAGVHHSNKASIRAFLANGFIIKERDGEFFKFRKEIGNQY